MTEYIKKEKYLPIKARGNHPETMFYYVQNRDDGKEYRLGYDKIDWRKKDEGCDREG